MNLKYNNGVYIDADGTFYSDSKGSRIIELLEAPNGYLYIPNCYLKIQNTISVKTPDQTVVVEGQWAHKMVVFSWGDRNGQKYNENLPIDHINMNHKDNRVENLEIVPTAVNLARAIRAIDYKEGQTLIRYDEYMKNLKNLSEECYDLAKQEVLNDILRKPTSSLISKIDYINKEQQ